MKKLRQTGRCPFRVRIYRQGRQFDFVYPDGLSPETRQWLHKVNAGFRMASPIAVLASSDSWQVSNAFLDHHGIDMKQGIEEVQKRYMDVLHREYKNSLADVPQALKVEAVFTFVKGPGLIGVHRNTFYRREGDRIVIDRDTETPGFWNSGLVPDWWETVVQ